jgi:hypothetical protein
MAAGAVNNYLYIEGFLSFSQLNFGCLAFNSTPFHLLTYFGLPYYFVFFDLDVISLLTDVGRTVFVDFTNLIIVCQLSKTARTTERSFCFFALLFKPKFIFLIL